MKKFLIAVVSVIGINMIEVAQAHNNNWTGFYAGMNAGFAFNNSQLTAQQLSFTSLSGTYNMHSNFSTFSPGMQIGYMHQFAHALVSGIEANLNLNTHQNDTLSYHSEFNSAVYDRFAFNNQMQTAIKARLGHVQTWKKNLFLPYVMAGASLVNVGLSYENEGGDYYSDTSAHLGWLVGAGIEWAFMQHWSLRTEYYFVDYGKAIKLEIPTLYDLYDSNGNATVNLNSNNIVVAINYWI